MSDKLKVVEQKKGQILKFEPKKPIPSLTKIEIAGRMLAESLTYDEVGAAAKRYQEIAEENKQAADKKALPIPYDWSYER